MKNSSVLKIILLVSIFALVAAYFIEHILGYKPCNLCLVERLPYFGAVIIIFINLSFKKFEKITFLLLTLIFCAATILSFYHFGIEQGFFTESLVCNSNNEIGNLTKEDLIKQLQEQPVSCKNVDFTLFGLSLATINTIISLILTVINLKIFLNHEKKK